MSDATDRSRQLHLEQQREQMSDEFQRRKISILRENEVRISASMSSKFAKPLQDWEVELKRDTVGLVSFDDFQRRRALLEQQRLLEQQVPLSLPAATKRPPPLAKRAKLSFAADHDDLAADSRDAAATERGGLADAGVSELQETLADAADTLSTSTAQDRLPKKRLRNPDVDTSFLPDRQRDVAEQTERERLRTQWQTVQDAIKAETIVVTFSYWDGRGHRRDVSCAKGDTIARFLDKARMLFPELKNVSVDSLMFIKEDLILPQHFTFYELIVTKARGKSGPLFSFDVHDDVRLLHDATQEKQDSHAGKVVERRWYEKNKHIFPASRWEVFDPDKALKK